METKICDYCKELKKISNFTVTYQKRSGTYISDTCSNCLSILKKCKICCKDKPIKAFAKDRSFSHKNEKCKVYVRDICSSCRVIARKQKQKQKLMEHIGQLKCQKCGIDDIRVLSFHHNNSESKDFKLSSKLNYSLNVTKLEAEKCKVLCANCHIIEHLE